MPLRGEETAVGYAIGERSWSVRLPAIVGDRRVAYAACNGNDDEGNGGPVPAWRNALWRGLAAEHARQPFHLLLQGGDQLYADTLWQEVPELGAWRRLPWREGNARPFTPTMAERAHAYFLESYLRLWKQPETAALLASIPSVMMWDDHDIFDGWGSWPEERQGCPVFQGVFAVARDHFALFQLAARADRLPEGFGDRGGGHFGCAFRAGAVGIVAPDLRSERTRGRIMGEAGWRDFEAALDDLTGCRHVLVMSSVPLVNSDMSWLERLYVAAPGHSNLEDDLRDQWQSFGHRAEWRRILACLVAFSARTGARVTALSGEIHLGAFGVVEGADGVQIHQLTSSGIVHAPPPAVAVIAYEWLGRHTTVLEPGLRARLLAIPGTAGATCGAATGCRWTRRATAGSGRRGKRKRARPGASPWTPRATGRNRRLPAGFVSQFRWVRLGSFVPSQEIVCALPRHYGAGTPRAGRPCPRLAACCPRART